MPGIPATTPNYGFPRYSNDDEADFAGEVNAISDLLDEVLGDLATMLDAIAVPLGVPLAYPAATLPPGGKFDWADGGLLDRTAFPAFNALVGSGGGHVYNGGVDPGSNKVRKPDGRGRGLMGADAMPASALSGAAGAAGRLTAAAGHNNLLGQTGGEERHTQTLSELVAHTNPVPTAVYGGDAALPAATTHEASGDLVPNARDSYTDPTGYSAPSDSAGGGAPFNVVQPYQIFYWIVRIA